MLPMFVFFVSLSLFLSFYDVIHSTCVWLFLYVCPIMPVDTCVCIYWASNREFHSGACWNALLRWWAQSAWAEGHGWHNSEGYIKTFEPPKPQVPYLDQSCQAIYFRGWFFCDEMNMMILDLHFNDSSSNNNCINYHFYFYFSPSRTLLLLLVLVYYYYYCYYYCNYIIISSSNNSSG